MRVNRSHRTKRAAFDERALRDRLRSRTEGKRLACHLIRKAGEHVRTRTAGLASPQCLFSPYVRPDQESPSGLEVQERCRSPTGASTKPQTRQPRKTAAATTWTAQSAMKCRPASTSGQRLDTTFLQSAAHRRRIQNIWSRSQTTAA